MIQKRKRRRDGADGGDVLWRWRRDDEVDDGADDHQEEKDKAMLLVLVPVLVMKVTVRSRENRMRMALMMALPLT